MSAQDLLPVDFYYSYVLDRIQLDSDLFSIRRVFLKANVHFDKKLSWIADVNLYTPEYYIEEFVPELRKALSFDISFDGKRQEYFVEPYRYGIKKIDGMNYIRHYFTNSFETRELAVIEAQKFVKELMDVVKLKYIEHGDIILVPPKKLRVATTHEFYAYATIRKEVVHNLVTLYYYFPENFAVDGKNISQHMQAVLQSLHQFMAYANTIEKLSDDCTYAVLIVACEECKDIDKSSMLNKYDVILSNTSKNIETYLAENIGR